MEKPSRKLKRILMIIGITGAVYVSFRYLLPLVIPFFIAYGVALFLKRPVMWLHWHISWKWRGKKRYFPIAAAGMILLVWLIGLFFTGCYLGGYKLVQECQRLSEAFPKILNGIDRELTGICYKIEGIFHIKSGVVPGLLREGILHMVSNLHKTAMTYLVGNSMSWFQKIIQAAAFFFITIMAVILFLQEMEELRLRRERSVFRQEFAMISTRIVNVGKAYIKTQGSIMFVTMAVCAAGLFLMRNPYYFLLGVTIGILDALPILGTGTVFLPWIFVELFQRDWKSTGGLMLIYGVCYFVREIMEAKMMGNEVGLSPLETLAAIYVGLLLFGLGGFILGPMGLLLIEDFVKTYCKDCEEEDTSS